MPPEIEPPFDIPSDPNNAQYNEYLLFLQAIERARQHNIQTLTNLIQSGQFAEWLTQAIESDDFSDLILEIKATTETRATSMIVAGLPEDVKAQAKEALAIAISQWDPDQLNPTTLQELSYFALDIGAVDVVPSIARHIQSDEVDLNTTRHLVATISGFTGTEEPAKSLLELYTNPNMHPEITPNLFLGLVAARPNRYPHFLLDFLKYRDYYKQHRDSHFMDWMFRTMANYIPADILQAHLAELPPEVAHEVQSAATRNATNEPFL